MKYFFLIIITLQWSLNCFAQSNCEGNACPEVSVVWEQATATSYAAYKWTNNSSRKIKINVRTLFGFNCMEGSDKILNPHESISYIGGYCIPFKANYTEPLATPPPLPSPPPLIKEGNYRIKNVASGLYLSGQFFDRLLNERFPDVNSQLIEIGSISCKTVTAKDDNAKWHIKRVHYEKNTDHYEIGTKRINDIVLCSRNFNWIVKEISINDDNTEDKQYGKTNKLGLESRKFVPSYSYRAWIIQKVNGTEYYKIRSTSGFYFLFYDEVKGEMFCDEILGEPKSALWILEECQ